MVGILGQVVTITLAADAGGAIGIAIDARRHLHRLVWMATGAMLAVTCLDMLPEAYARLGPLQASASAVLGAALIAWMARKSPSVCPACDVGHAPSVSRSGVWLVTLALAVHCTLDGIGLAASRDSGVGVFFGMALHKLPEGLALTLLLLGSGLRREAALGWTLFAEAFTLAGAGSVVWLGPLAQGPSLAILVAFVGGGFLVLVLRTLCSVDRSAAPWAFAGFAVTGLVSILSR